MWIDRRRASRYARWWLIGLVCLGLGLLLLFVLHDLLGVPLPLSSLVGGITVTVLQFLSHDRFVFGHARPSWPRLRNYAVATAGSFALTWTILNILGSIGVHYAIAAIVATGGSVVLSTLTNFGWVWRSR